MSNTGRFLANRGAHGRRGARRAAVFAVLIALCAALVGCAGMFGPEPPESLKQAGTDQTWAADQIAKLPHV